MHRSISKIGYSQSFAISNNCLDSCPKCGQNICEHTSVADVINLPNSISQDFSTYSSDSSLIKQMLGNDSTQATAAQQFKNSNKHINFSRLSINTLNNYKNSKYNNGSNFYLNQNKQSQIIKLKNDDAAPKQIDHFTTRPHSCQVISIDNETTDKLLREFFENTPPSSPEKSSESNLGTIKRNNDNQIQSNEIQIGSDPSSDTQIENLAKLTKIASQKVKNQKKKKTKFSNFRLFLKSSNKSDIKSASKCAMRSRGLVHCLTSSASSSGSSCEDVRPHRRFLLGRHKKDSLGKKSDFASSTENEQIAEYKGQKKNKTENGEEKIEDHNEIRIQLNTNKIPENALNIKSIQYSKSAFSITSKISNFMCEVDDYNEVHNLELCPIAFGDADEDFTHSNINTNTSEKNGIKATASEPKFESENCSKSSDCKNKNCKKTFCNNNINSNNFNNNKIVNNHTNTTNINNISSVISVPLNTYLFYNYERKGDNQSSKYPDSDKTNESGSKSKTSITADSVVIPNRIAGQIVEHAPFKTQALPTRKAPIEKMSNIIPYTDYADAPSSQPKTSSRQSTGLKEPPATSRSLYAHNQKGGSSYYTSCSSLDQSLTLTASSGTTHKSHTLSKYHSVTIIFVLIGLFGLNSLQELFMIFYYFSTEQTHWLLSSLTAIFCGQFITLVITLLADIDLINLTPPLPSHHLLSSVSSHLGAPSPTSSLKHTYADKKSHPNSQEAAKELINSKRHEHPTTRDG